MSSSNPHSVIVGSSRLHVREQGDGPLVVLIHGFPETSFSWRHQLPALADAGYRAVAVDIRGYGRSTKPTAVDDYRMTEIAADVAGLVPALGADRAVLVGHDWGSPISTSTALLSPDVIAGVAMLSVPYQPRGPHRPTDVFARIGGDNQFYISYFQTAGAAESEIEPDIRAWLRGIYRGLAGETKTAENDAIFMIPPGRRMSDAFTDGPLPSWLSEAEFDEIAASFESTGLTGGLNRYRNMDRDWLDLADYAGAPITQPSLFIGGEKDASTGWNAAAIEALTSTAPAISGRHLLPDAGHWIQQERPDEVNRLLIDWLNGLELDGR